MNILYHVIGVLLSSVMAIPDAGSQNEISFLDSAFVWTEHHNFMNGDSESYRFTIDDESVMVSGKPYFNVLTAFGEFSENWQGISMLIREENNIVYAVGYFGEGELYNFNLMVNDTFNSVLSGSLVVDSIGLILLENGEQRKFWRFHPDYTAYPIIWVEGIGNLAGLFAKDCFADCGGTSILCMYRNDTLLYDNPVIDSCWLLPVATTEINKEMVFLVPNPADESIKIEGLETDVFTVQVFSTLGNLIYQGNENQIDLMDFPPGYYYAAILLNENQYVIKGFLKQ